MLESAFESWIDCIGERDFDLPFLSLLRSNGFYDIHFTHGAYEFGKDFIAKRDEPQSVQYGIQSKAGDIGGAEWNQIYGQLEELVGTFLSHPNFDEKLPKVFILLITGRLVGKATIGPSEFRRRLEQQGRGTFLVWDRDTLLEMLEGSSRFPGRPTPALEALIGSSLAGPVSDREVEKHTATVGDLKNREALRALVDCSVLSAALERRGQPFQALATALCSVRAAASLAHQDASHTDLLLGSMRSYITMGERVLAPQLSSRTDPRGWMHLLGGGPGMICTYPLLCLRIFEFCGLSSLYWEDIGDEGEAARFADYCKDIIEHQRGTEHPISDRCASSLAPGILAIWNHGYRTQAKHLIKECTKWLCDVYENSKFGLAGPYTDPEGEVEVLLGAPLEEVSLCPRRESLLAIALADLAYVVAPDDLYGLVINDLQAVGIVASGLHALDDVQAFRVQGTGGTCGLLNPRYPSAGSAELLAHHKLQGRPRLLEDRVGPSVLLAIACVTRDRLFSDCYPRALRGGALSRGATR